MTMRRSTRTAFLAAFAFIGAACGRESSDDAAGGVSSSGGSLGTAGAHEHGVARVNIAVEGEGAVIELFAPGQSVYGFEGEPRDADQAAARAAGLERLKEQIPRMFAFDPSLDCRFAAPRVELEHEDHHDEAEAHSEHQEEAHEEEAHGEADESEHAADEGQHDEVHAEVEVQCTRSPAGTDLRLAVTESFPDIVQVDLQVLSDTRQSGARVAASGHTVRL